MKLLLPCYQIFCLALLLNLIIIINGSFRKGQTHLRAGGNQLLSKEKNLLTIPMQKKPHHPNRSQKLIQFLKDGQSSLRQRKFTNGALNFLQKSDGIETELQFELQHESNSESMPKQGLVEIQLNNFLDTQYSGNISVGTANNTLNVVFDTGSTLLWVNSIRCIDFECSRHAQYDHNRSRHFEPILEDKLYSTLFGSGELTGVLSKDWIFLGDLVVKKFEFAEIVRQDAILEDADFDGVMGLSFPDQDEEFGVLQSIIDSIRDQGLLAKNMFSFYLRRDAGVQDSKIIFGGYDEELLVEPITWGDVVGTDYWMVKGENILVGGEDYGLCIDGCYFIMDTGTSILTGPTFQLELLLDSIEVDDECKNYYQLPPITFVIEGQHFSLDPVDYILALGQTEAFLPYDEPKVSEIVDCVSVFYPMDLAGEQNGNVWILGDTFLSKFYTIFDRDNMKVGVALQKSAEI